jgi:hypothetical protein
VIVPRRKLSPGTYYIQMIFHSRFISSPEWDLPEGQRGGQEPWDQLAADGKRIKEAWKRCTEADLFRSNWVKIELVDR